MQVKIKKGLMNGSLDIISSKSYAHRYIISSMLSEADSVLKNVYISKDILATLSCLKCFDKVYEIRDNLYISHKACNTDKVFDCNESGSTLRFLIPIALIKFNKVKFIGKESLFKRGLDVYLNLFKENNINYNLTSNSIEISGKFINNVFNIPGNVSSQYLTGLLFALPLLNFDTTINVTTKLESKRYVDITLDVLKQSGIDIKVIGNSYYIKGNQHYNLKSSSIEGDYSNAAFFAAFNYLGSNIQINGLNPDSLQGDKVYVNYFKELDNKFTTIDISDCIDLGPVLFTFAALKNGGKFIGTKRLRIKESDRVESITSELRKCGADIDIYEDSVVINKVELHKPNTSLSSHNDHRVVMSLTLLSSLFDITIDGIEAVEKSYPSFFMELAKLGLEVQDETITK